MTPQLNSPAFLRKLMSNLIITMLKACVVIQFSLTGSDSSLLYSKYHHAMSRVFGHLILCMRIARYITGENRRCLVMNYCTFKNTGEISISASTRKGNVSFSCAYTHCAHLTSMNQLANSTSFLHLHVG